MKYLCPAVAAIILGVGFAVAQTDNNWQAYDASYSGYMNDPNHWKYGVPTLEHYARFTRGVGTYTVSIPSEYEMKSNFRADSTSGDSITFNWDGCVFRQPALGEEEGNYHNEPFGFRYNDSHFFNLQTYGLSQKHAVSEISNGVIRVTTEGGHPRLDFDKGVYNFRTPCESAAWAPYFMLFADGCGLKGKARTVNSSVYFHEGTEFNSGTLYIQGNSVSNLLCFDGGRHTITGSIQIPTAKQTYANDCTHTTVRIADTAEVYCSSYISIGATPDSTFGSTTNKSWTLEVVNGGKLTTGGNITPAFGGTADISVRDGGELTTVNIDLPSGESITGRMEVANATLNLKGTMRVGSVENSKCIDDVLFHVTNSTVNQTVAGVVNPTGAGILVEDSDWNVYVAHTVNATNKTAMTFRRSNVDLRPETTLGNRNNPILISLEDSTLYSSNGIVVRGNTELVMSNSYVVVSNGNSGCATSVKMNGKVVVAGNGIYRQFGPLKVGLDSGDNGTVEIRGGTNYLMGSVYAGVNSGTTGTVTVAGGYTRIVTRADKPTWSCFTYVGQEVGARGTLNVTGGEIDGLDTYGIIVGNYGVGDMNVSGGSTTVYRVSLGFLASSVSGTNRYTQTGGYLATRYNNSDYGIRATCNSGSIPGVITLNGGVTKCGQFLGGPGEGYFYANGGKILVPSANTTSFFNGFAEAALGEEGLEIESDYAITTAQDFTNIDRAAGRLVLAGTGAKTFTGTGTDISVLEVTGGSASVSASASFGDVLVKNGATFAFDDAVAAGHVGTLRLGDSETVGTLTVRPGETIAVDSFVVSNAYVVFDGEFAAGDYTLVSCSGAIDAATMDAWARAIVVGGMPEGFAAVFSCEEDGGATLFKMTVRASALIVKSLASGTSTDSDDVAFVPGDTLRAAVEEGATLTLSGTLARGAFEKTGDGKVVLSNIGNNFLSGVTLYNGILSVPDTAALGLGDSMATAGLLLTNGTLEVTGPAEGARLDNLSIESPSFTMGSGTAKVTGHGAVIIKNDVDLVMPPLGTAAAGLIKRGAGTLTVEGDGTSRFTDTRGRAGTNVELPGTQWVFPASGSAPSVTYAAVNIAEGNLTLKGTGATPAEFDTYGSVWVGVPTKGISAMPSLTIDNAKFISKSSSTRFHIGSQMQSDRSDVTEMIVTVTNNSTLNADTYQIGQSSTLASGKILVNVDSSDMSASYAFYASANSTASNLERRFSFRNGSRMLAPRLYAYCNVSFDFDNSILAKDASNNPITTQFRMCYSGAKATFAFRNGSELRTKVLDYNASTTEPAGSGTVRGGAMQFTFSNSKWIPGTDNFSFAFPTLADVSVIVEDEGIVLEPPSGKTWNWGLPISGGGGMVVGGAGTLVLTGSQWSATGVARVKSGATLSLGGTTATGLVVGGPGVVTDGTVSNGGICVAVADDGSVTNGIPSLSGVAFSGKTRVDISRAGAPALAKPYVTVAVASYYSGTAPDVSSWRVANTGASAIAASFEARDGFIYMTPLDKPGLTIIVQ